VLISGDIPTCDLRCARGEALSRTIRIETGGTPRPLGGLTVTLVVEDQGEDVVRLVRGTPPSAIGGTITVDDAGGGVSFVITSTITAALSHAATWALWLQQSSTTEADMIVSGHLRTERTAR
jgi:hypothetical protein